MQFVDLELGRLLNTPDLLHVLNDPRVTAFLKDELFAQLTEAVLVMQEHKVTAALSNSFGFGGTNATLVFQRHQG